MPGIETSIWMAIKSRIDSLSLSWSRAWPGEIFNSSGVSPYLRIGRVSASPAGMMIKYGTPNDRRGSLIITIVYPLSEKRPHQYYDEIASQITAHFADGTLMRYDAACVKVTEYPHVQPGYESDGFWNVPITIPWRTFI